MLKEIKTFIISIVIVLQTLTFFSCKIKNEADGQSTPEQSEQQELIKELNQWLFPLGPSPMQLTDTQLVFLAPLQEAKIVALGEATHGTKEFFQMKHRAFQYFVEYFGHKAFGFEADFAESIYLNNYVTKGEGNLEELMTTKMHFWVWKTKEVKELLEWMRDYNQDKKEEDMIHYFGIDCQFFTYQPILLREYLQGILPDFWDTAAPLLDRVQNLPRRDFEDMTGDEFFALKGELESLEDQFETNKEQLVLASSTRDFKIHKQLLHTFLQAFIVRYYSAQRSGGKYFPGDDTNWRDRFMAENTRWVTDLLGEDSKITLWAHNAHIARDKSSPVNAGAMGYCLDQELNDRYRTVGFAFSQGSFTAKTQGPEDDYSDPMVQDIIVEPINDSINSLFHQAQQREFAFRLDTIPADSYWDQWLAETNPILLIGGAYSGSPEHYYWDIPIREHYDWLIYFDSTTASELLE